VLSTEGEISSSRDSILPLDTVLSFGLLDASLKRATEKTLQHFSSAWLSSKKQLNSHNGGSCQ